MFNGGFRKKLISLVVTIGDNSNQYVSNYNWATCVCVMQACLCM